jgi:gliding motility-associated-like protein
VDGSPFQNSPFKYGVDLRPLQYSGDFFNLKAGSHLITAVNNFGCETKFAVIIPEPNDATADVLPRDTTIQLGESIQLTSSFGPYPASAVVSYSWSPSLGLSCIDCPNPIVNPYNRITQYVLTITYNNHCVVTSGATIIVENNLQVFIPNSFSPNGDGNNDVFQIYGEGIKTVDLKIFNRWGELMYQTNNQFSGWGGTYKGVLQNPAVFVYDIQITYLDDKKTHRVGSISLIR